MVYEARHSLPESEGFDLNDAEVVMASLPDVNARTGGALAPATGRQVVQVFALIPELAEAEQTVRITSTIAH